MIHKYSLMEKNIVLDVFSGAVHVVDDIAYDLLDCFSDFLPEQCPQDVVEKLGKYSKADLQAAYSELLELQKDDALFSEDDYGEFAQKMVESPIKSLCLNVSHDCNLRCAYCFAGKGDYNQGRMVMSEEIAIKAVDFLIEHSTGRENLELDFFGGEPLLNFDVVRSVVEYARSKEKKHNKTFRFTITTNGVLLDDEKIDYINKEMSNVVLSLDGRQETNDKMRTHIDGSGSYNTVVDSFKKLVDKRGDKEYYLRGTFTKHNKDFSNDVLDIFEKGFDQISVEPVVSDSSMPYAITQEDLPEIFAEYEKLTKILLEQRPLARQSGRVFNFFHFMIDLEQGPCAIKRLRGCGCGNEYVAITPDGDIYPCHQFIGHEEWKMGSIVDNTLDTDMKKKFSQTTIYQKDECTKCWARFYCSGGCSANNMQYQKDVLIPHKISCELEKKRLECAIVMQAFGVE